MANYNKSFNFRNGVQVDDTNFVINANGLVGIGTSIPREVLDVHGNVKVTGFITATTIYTSVLEVERTSNTLLNVGVVSITSAGIVTASSSGGIVTYYGDGGKLINLPTSQWIDVDPGFGYTSIYAAGNVGVATTYPNYTFQVGGNVGAGQSGIGISSEGNVITTGIVTAYKFVGIGSDLTILDASNVSLGTLNNSRLPSNVNLSGIITGYSFSGFGTDINGINASNISNGTLNNSRLPSNIDVSGIVTASKFVGIGSDLTILDASNIGIGTLNNSRLPSNINVSGIITGYSFSGFGTDISGINASNISNGTLNNSRLPSNINVSGIITATEFVGTNFVGVAFSGSTFVGTAVTANTFTGDLVGTASTAQTLTGTPNINVGIVTASKIIADSLEVRETPTGITTITKLLHVGTGGTIFSASSNAIGIGTGLPSSNLQLVSDYESLVEFISNSDQSRISIGQSIGIGRSNGIISFGSADRTFELLNNDTGDFNMYLHAGPTLGLSTGNFNWIYGQTFGELMTLTYEGDLGLGKTNPDNTLHVVGTSTVTGNAWIGGDLTVSGILSASSIPLPSLLYGINIESYSGISTFSYIDVTNRLYVSDRIGIGTDIPTANLDAYGKQCLLGSVGINTELTDLLDSNSSLLVNGVTLTNKIGIGTTSVEDYGDLVVNGNISVHPGDDSALSYINLNNVEVHSDKTTMVGIGTTLPQAVVDFSHAGESIPGKIASFMLPPAISESDRVGLVTSPGAIIYNTTSNTHQGYNGTGWFDLY